MWRLTIESRGSKYLVGWCKDNNYVLRSGVGTGECREGRMRFSASGLTLMGVVSVCLKVGID